MRIPARDGGMDLEKAVKVSGGVFSDVYSIKIVITQAGQLVSLVSCYSLLRYNRK
jgi:hypothetical protein